MQWVGDVMDLGMATTKLMSATILSNGRLVYISGDGSMHIESAV